MAVISVVFGSVLGFFAAVLGWVVFDLSFLEAFSLYLMSSLGCGALGIATALLLPEHYLNAQLRAEL